MNRIALVNQNDEIIGFAEKQEAHLKDFMHRAFSIFVFNSEGELMLHQRAFDKYHSPGLWTNTCCSHLPEGMEMEEAVHVRLREEMGFDVELQYLTKFHYRIEFSNGLIENEIDHIYVGFYNELPNPDPSEVAGYKWMSLPELKLDIDLNPDNYTYWLKHIIHNHYEDLDCALQQLLVNK